MVDAQILERIDIFCDLTREQLERIFTVCQQVVYFRGELIFAENSPSTEIYVILDGEVAIEIDPDLVGAGDRHQPPDTIAILRPGQSFGEIALVDQGLRSASARCNTMLCKVLVISRQDLMGLLKEDHEMGFIIMGNLARDLCLKLRLSNLNMREALLNLPRKQKG